MSTVKERGDILLQRDTIPKPGGGVTIRFCGNVG